MFIAICAASAQRNTRSLNEPPRPYENFAMRLQGGIALTTYSASFTSSADIIDCGALEFGNGAGAALNAVFEFRTADRWGIGVGLGYSGRSGQFTRTNIYPVRDTVTNKDTSLTTTMSVEPDIAFLELQADVRIALLGNYETRSLGLVIGPRIALPLHTRFEQFETVVSPSNATFLVDGQRTQQRAIAGGVLTTRSYALYGVSASLESFITLSDNISIVPQLTFDYFANSMLDDVDWKLLGVRAEIGIRFGFNSKPLSTSEPKQPIVRKPDPVPPPPPVVDERPPYMDLATPTYTAELVSGDELSATSPIVNAVFFDSASASIPSYYVLKNDGTLPSPDPVQAHAHILVRIADILSRNPQGSVMLEGATSGADESGVELAERRAQTVGQSLINLGIAPSRIQIRAAISPRIPSNAEFVGGREENRRVDILVRNAPLQEWVTVQQFSEVRGRMSVHAVPVSGMGQTMRVRVGARDTTVSKSIHDVDLPFSASVTADANGARVRVTAESGSSYAERFIVIDTSKLEHRSSDLKTSDFEAVLRFDYNSAELNDDVRALLTQLTERLPAGSAITIYGSTDALGTDTRNKELSLQRAKVTEDFIRGLIGNKFIIETSTSGARFADLTPQGRFLNRSIRITVRTK